MQLTGSSGLVTRRASCPDRRPLHQHKGNVVCHASLPEQAASIAGRLQDDAAWQQLQPHFGANAARDLAGQIGSAAAGLVPKGGQGGSFPQLPAVDLSGVQLPAVKLPTQLPSIPRLPDVQLPKVQLPSLPSELPDPATAAAAVRDAAAAAAHLPAALAEQLEQLQQLLLSEPQPGGVGIGLEPHFGTRWAQLLLEQVAATLSAAFGAVPVLPPILQLPTGAADARLIGAAAAAGGGAAPDALAHAWMAASEQLAALLPDGAAQALAAAAAQQQVAMAAAGEAASSLLGAAAALPSSGYHGVDGATLCLAVAGALAATAASVPPGDHEASASAPNGSSAEAPLSYEYDPDAVASYFSRRPVAVATRAAELAREAAALGLALLGDVATGRLAANEAARARQLRGAIERLGPAYVKVAQALSTRVDLLSPEYFTQIQMLQDRVPPFPCEEAKEAMAKAFGRPVDEVLSRVSERPVAAASLGQVYRGTLVPGLGGGEVAVKVQRPGVLEQVALDLYLMRRVAAALSSVPDVRTDWASLIDNWATRFLHEMDYAREACNAVTWAAQMQAAGVDGVAVARPVEELCSGFVLTTEWIDGEKLSESKASDVRSLCTTLLNAYLIQLLETGFLHADPHPGNLIRTNDGKICVLDFGLMTEVTPDQRIALVEYISHLTTQDWPNVARDLQTLGFIPEDAGDPATLGLVEPLGRILSQLSGGGGATKLNIDSVMAELEQLGRDYPFSIPPFFALILRAFSVIEGIALRVDPDYAIVMECFPYISRRLLSDDDPRVRQALKDVLYGGKQRLDVERLVRLADGFSAFTTDGLADGEQQQQQAVAAAARQQQAPSQRQQQQQPALDPAARDALRLIFSQRGSYVQELLVEELVAAADALSRDAAAQLLGSLLASGPASAALSRVRALGPLRPLLLPLPTPLELLTALAPAVRLTAEDEEAIGVVRGVLQLAMRMQGGPDPTAAPTAPPAGALASAGEALSGAARVAGELRPLLPEIAPGLQYTGDLLMRALAKRLSQRLSEAAGDVAAAAAAAAPRGGGGGGGGGGGAPAPAWTFAPEPSLESPAAASMTDRAGAAAGQLIVGLAAAPLVLALAPLGLLAMVQQEQQRQLQQGRQ